MASERTQKLRRIFSIALSGVIILAGICLMVACVGIYLSGDEPFSREAVAAAFSPISIPVYLCLIMVLLGFVFQILCPDPAFKPVVMKQHSVVLNRLRARADLESCSSELRTQILAQQQRRNRYSRICALVLTVCSLVFLIYALDSRHFHPSDINRSMIRAMTVLLPCLAVSIATCIFTVSARQKSIQQEIELLKQCPKADTPLKESPKASSFRNIRYVLLLAALALAVFGYAAGGTADVLTKAVNICTECIGLG